MYLSTVHLPTLHRGVVIVRSFHNLRMSMSWSDGRQNDGGNSDGLSKQKKIDALNSINSVLAMLASDEDLHEDLQLPIVKMAMAHWTGENRLPGGTV